MCDSEMKDIAKVCRLCSCDSGFLLDLFGSSRVSYVKEIEYCLSLEVKEGDGFPQVVCVKCLGQLEECSPYFKKVNDLHNRGIDKNSIKNICYFCQSDENKLFSIPQNSLVQTKSCFDFQVPKKAKICHRCQYFLDTLSELRQKTQSAQVKFGLNNFPRKAVTEEEDTVEDIVHKLKHKFGSRPTMPPIRKKKITEGSVVQIHVMDVCAYMGSSYFSNGSVKVTEFLKSMPSKPRLKRVRFSDERYQTGQYPSQNGHVSDDCYSSCGGESPIKPSTKRFKGSNSEKIKVSLKLTKNIHSTLSDKSFDSSEEDSWNDTPSSREHTKRSHNNTAGGRHQRAKSPPRRFKAQEDVANESDTDSSPQPRRNSIGINKKQSSLHSSKSSKSRSPLSHSPSEVPVVENALESSDKNEDILPRRRRAKRVKYNVDESDPPSDLDSNSDSGMFAAKTPKQKQRISGNQTATASKRVYFEPPDYQKDVDKVLVHTPKSTFKPYICPTCHEGYVSTVKGKLHRLMVHDLRSKFDVKLIRAEDCEDVNKYLSKKPQKEAEDSFVSDNENNALNEQTTESDSNDKEKEGSSDIDEDLLKDAVSQPKHVDADKTEADEDNSEKEETVPDEKIQSGEKEIADKVLQEENESENNLVLSNEKENKEKTLTENVPSEKTSTVEEDEKATEKVKSGEKIMDSGNEDTVTTDSDHEKLEEEERVSELIPEEETSDESNTDKSEKNQVDLDNSEREKAANNLEDETDIDHRHQGKDEDTVSSAENNSNQRDNEAADADKEISSKVTVSASEDADSTERDQDEGIVTEVDQLNDSCESKNGDHPKKSHESEDINNSEVVHQNSSESEDINHSETDHQNNPCESDDNITAEGDHQKNYSAPADDITIERDHKKKSCESENITEDDQVSNLVKNDLIEEAKSADDISSKSEQLEEESEGI